MSAKLKKNSSIRSFPPPFTLFNATTAFLSFVSAEIIPNRRSKGGDATSIITPHAHGYLYAYRNTLNMANRDLNRLKVVLAKKKRTNCWLAALKSIFGKQILKKNIWRNQIKPYFCNTRIRHASHRTAYQGGTFCLYAYGIYVVKVVLVVFLIALNTCAAPCVTRNVGWTKLYILFAKLFLLGHKSIPIVN